MEHEHQHGTNESDNELIVLIRYMIAHNESHNRELKDLADSLEKTGNKEAYAKVLSAIEKFAEGNDELRRALEEMKK